MHSEGTGRHTQEQVEVKEVREGGGAGGGEDGGRTVQICPGGFSEEGEEGGAGGEERRKEHSREKSVRPYTHFSFHG